MAVREDIQPGTHGTTGVRIAVLDAEVGGGVSRAVLAVEEAA